MQTIKIKNVVGSGLDSDFDNVSTVQIENKPFAEAVLAEYIMGKKSIRKKLRTHKLLKYLRITGKVVPRIVIKLYPVCKRNL